MFQSSNSWWVFYIGSLTDHITLSKQSLSGCVKCIAQGVMRGYQSSHGKGLLCSWPELLEILHSPGDFNQYWKKESCSSCSSCLMFRYEWAVLVGCIKGPSIISVPFLVRQTLFHMLVLLSIAIPPRTHSIALFQNLLGCLVPT